MRTTPNDNDSQPRRRRAAGTDATAARPPPRRGAGKRSGSLLRHFAEASDAVFWLADLDAGRLLYVGPRFEALWGDTTQALLEDPACWNRAVLRPHAAQLPQPFFADDPTQGDSEREYRIRGRDGNVRWIRDRRFVLRSDSAGAHCIGGIAEDVTEHRERDARRAELLQREKESTQLLLRERDARAQAEHAAQAKDEFLSVVTHELRSPLNAIRGWSHVLRHSGGLLAPQIKALDAIDRNTQAQAHLVDDLLDSQRILCGKLELEISRVPLAALIEEAMETVRPAAQLKRLRLEASHDASIDMINVDPDRLRQAMVKLLSNAVKFTPEDGIVTVRSRRAGESLAIDVQDTGVVNVTMTLTAPGCPAAGSLPLEVEDKARDVSGVTDVKVDVVWDPPWTMDLMSDEAKLELGLL